MASVDLYPGTQFPYVTVSFAVGSKEHGTRYPADNMRTDKMLVYYLLWYIHTCDKSGKYKPLDKLPTQFDYTGNNSYLAKLIGEYQKKNIPTLYPDARVDRVRNAYKTSITKTVYTILHLYHSFEFILFEAQTIKKMGELETVFFITNEDIVTPPELKAELLRSMNISSSN